MAAMEPNTETAEEPDWFEIPWTRRICLQQVSIHFHTPQLEMCFNDPTEWPFMNDCILAIEFLNTPQRPTTPAQTALLLHYHITCPTNSAWTWPALCSAHILRRSWPTSTRNLLQLWTNPIEWSPYRANDEPMSWGLRLLQQIIDECQIMLTSPYNPTQPPPSLRHDAAGRLRAACNQCANITYDRCDFCHQPLCHLCFQFNITIEFHHNCDSLSHKSPPDIAAIYRM